MDETQQATQAVPAATPEGVLALIAPGIQQAVLDKAATVATQTVTQVAADFHARSTEAIGQVAGRVEQVAASVAPTVSQAVNDAIPQIKAEVLADVRAVSDNIQKDAVTQRHLALEVVGLLGVAALALFVAYLLGSPQAKGIVGWALLPGGIGGVIAARLMGLKVPGTGQ